MSATHASLVRLGGFEMDYAGVIGTVTASVGAVESVTKLVKSVRDAIKGDNISDVDIGELRTRVSDLFDVALSARQALFDMQDTVRALQSENEALICQISEMEAFDADIEKYELRAVSRNSFAYVKKGEAKKVGATPYLCMPCFDKRKKSALQLETPDFNFDTLKCPACGTPVKVPNDVKMEVYTGRSHTKWDLDDF
jgi:hypothetical protein